MSTSPVEELMQSVADLSGRAVPAGWVDGSGQRVGGDVAQRDVAVRRHGARHIERRLRVAALQSDDDADGLVDHRPLDRPTHRSYPVAHGHDSST